MTYRLLAFAPDGRRALFDVADDASLQANLAHHEGWVVRRLDASSIAGVATLADERIPKALAEFDAAYPGLQFPPLNA